MKGGVNYEKRRKATTLRIDGGLYSVTALRESISFIGIDTLCDSVT